MHVTVRQSQSIMVGRQDQLNEEDIRRYFYAKKREKGGTSGVTVPVWHQLAAVDTRTGMAHLRPNLTRSRRNSDASDRRSQSCVGRNLSLDYRTCLTTIYSCGLRLSERIELASEPDRQRTDAAAHSEKGKRRQRLLCSLARGRRFASYCAAIGQPSRHPVAG